MEEFLLFVLRPLLRLRLCAPLRVSLLCNPFAKRFEQTASRVVQSEHCPMLPNAAPYHDHLKKTTDGLDSGSSRLKRHNGSLCLMAESSEHLIVLFPT